MEKDDHERNIEASRIRLEARYPTHKGLKYLTQWASGTTFWQIELTLGKFYMRVTTDGTIFNTEEN